MNTIFFTLLAFVSVSLLGDLRSEIQQQRDIDLAYVYKILHDTGFLPT